MPKRLYRSGKDRVVGGVCGGLADYFDIDPLLIRIIFIILALSGGLGVLIYLAAWLIIPGQSLSAGQHETPPTPEERKPNMKRNPSGVVFGILIIVLGIGLLLHNYGLFYFKFNLIWPLILIAIGVRLLIRDKK
ncbi:MAG: PspC domain-containing protein [Candidatus Edwardsbacteria bacterium]|nr:PspC domain-containing protein [Candidatus Edwardsbacteria bacterium]MBU1577427.1 PspC domain-containing protein [Candidatus Edwardsbacteria bacterium]MBU2463415.1 PspC domain-containing protein [Candidatus Edwardsbacteria bacterium]MBU2592994.1 PspC domain-containing protein [Candidatus Edwardsbacteria bacterium]